MSFFGDFADGVKALILLKDDVAKLKGQVSTLDANERETRDRLAFLEGVIAGAQTRATTGRLPRR